MAVPFATSSLSLCFCFDLSAVPARKKLAQKDHQAAADAANAATALAPPGSVVCRSGTAEGDVDLAAVRALPFDEWHTPDPNTKTRLVRVDFLYSATGETLAIRVLTHLPMVDGVSATRLALHTLEAVEGTPIAGAAEEFKKNPPFKYGLRQRRNFARLLSGIIARDFASGVFGCCQAPLSDQEIAAPTTYRSMKAYYSHGGDSPATFRTYRPKNKSAAYKPFAMATDTWVQQSGMKGIFNLINLAAHEQGAVAASIVPKAADLLDMKKRYAGAFIGPAHPSGGEMWALLNKVHVNVIFSNNYGRHSHTFKSGPTEFLWDWLGMSAPVPGAGCISINGVFLAWTRWTPGGMSVPDAIYAPILGLPVASYDQEQRFKDAPGPASEAPQKLEA